MLLERIAVRRMREKAQRRICGKLLEGVGWLRGSWHEPGGRLNVSWLGGSVSMAPVQRSTGLEVSAEG